MKNSSEIDLPRELLEEKERERERKREREKERERESEREEKGKITRKHRGITCTCLCSFSKDLYNVDTGHQLKLLEAALNLTVAEINESKVSFGGYKRHLPSRRRNSVCHISQIYFVYARVGN